MTDLLAKTITTKQYPIFILLSLFFVTDLIAQVCDDIRIENSDPKQPYKLRGDGDYCEGMYIGTVSDPLILLSATYGRLAFDSRDSHIKITVPGASLLKSNKLYVKAKGLLPGVFYQMDALTTPAKGFSWATDQVLKPEKLSQDRIGVIGYVEMPKRRVFVPVHAKGNVTATKLPASAIDEIVFFKFRTPVSLKWLDYSLVPVTQKGVVNWKKLKKNNVQSGEIIVLPVKLTDIPNGGYFRLEINGEILQSGDKMPNEKERYVQFRERVFLAK